jgi:DNA-binding GntR family transcriptional regulator
MNTKTSRTAQTRSEWAQQELEDMIFRGELRPGDHIKEAQLAAKFNMSRGAIREVCRSLERTGLVVSIPHRGVFVRAYTVRETLEMFEVRAHLSDMAVRQAAMNVTPRKIIQLEGLIREMEEHMSRDDYGHQYMRLNWEFHKEITHLSDNTILIDLIEVFRKRQFVSCMLSIQTRETSLESNAEHKEIVAALKDGDPSRAADLLRKHILSGKQRFLGSVTRREASSRNASYA